MAMTRRHRRSNPANDLAVGVSGAQPDTPPLFKIPKIKEEYRCTHCGMTFNRIEHFEMHVQAHIFNAEIKL